MSTRRDPGRDADPVGAFGIRLGFRLPLGDDAALVPATPAIAPAYHALIEANRTRLARWESWAEQPQTLAGTTAYLARCATGWADGSQVATGVAVRTGAGWRLAGSAGLRVDGYARSAEVGYWIDAGHEGRGLVTRAVAALLDLSFGDLELARVELRAEVANTRSRAVARRLGFTEEGVLREGVAFSDRRADVVVHGLLAAEWRA